MGKSRADARRGGFSRYRAAVILIALLTGIGGGEGLANQAAGGFIYQKTPSYVTFLVSVVLNAWSIMLGVGEAENAMMAGKAPARKARRSS